MYCYDDLCIICHRDIHQLIPIDNDFRNKLFACMRLQVGRTIPLKVCILCRRKLDFSYNFQKQCRNSVRDVNALFPTVRGKVSTYGKLQVNLVKDCGTSSNVSSNVRLRRQSRKNDFNTENGDLRRVVKIAPQGNLICISDDEEPQVPAKLVLDGSFICISDDENPQAPGEPVPSREVDENITSLAHAEVNQASYHSFSGDNSSKSKTTTTAQEKKEERKRKLERYRSSGKLFKEYRPKKPKSKDDHKHQKYRRSKRGRKAHRDRIKPGLKDGKEKKDSKDSTEKKDKVDNQQIHYQTSDLTGECVATDLTNVGGANDLTNEGVPNDLTSEGVPNDQTPDLTGECVANDLTNEAVANDLTNKSVPNDQTPDLTGECVPNDLTSEGVPNDLTSEGVPNDSTSEIVSANFTPSKGAAYHSSPKSASYPNIDCPLTNPNSTIYSDKFPFTNPSPNSTIRFENYFPFTDPFNPNSTVYYDNNFPSTNPNPNSPNRTVYFDIDEALTQPDSSSNTLYSNHDFVFTEAHSPSRNTDDFENRTNVCAEPHSPDHTTENTKSDSTELSHLYEDVTMPENHHFKTYVNRAKSKQPTEQGQQFSQPIVEAVEDNNGVTLPAPSPAPNTNLVVLQDSWDAFTSQSEILHPKANTIPEESFLGFPRTSLAASDAYFMVVNPIIADLERYFRNRQSEDITEQRRMNVTNRRGKQSQKRKRPVDDNPNGKHNKGKRRKRGWPKGRPRGPRVPKHITGDNSLTPRATTSKIIDPPANGVDNLNLLPRATASKIIDPPANGVDNLNLPPRATTSKIIDPPANGVDNLNLPPRVTTSKIIDPPANGVDNLNLPPRVTTSKIIDPPANGVDNLNLPQTARTSKIIDPPANSVDNLNLPSRSAEIDTIVLSSDEHTE